MNAGEIIIVAVILIGVGVLATIFINGTIKTSQMVPAVQENDACKPQPGYTIEEWLQHMSHHPDIYAKCIKRRFYERKNL